MAEFGLKDYVVGSNNLYECEGTIIGMHESTGAKKGMLYTIKDNNTNMEHCFFAEEITRLAIPRMYHHTLEEMAKEYFYLNGDKRVARLDLYHNETKTIWKGRREVYLTFKAYGKVYEYHCQMRDIEDNFKNKTPRQYAHFKC